ncbi:hypothetical protein LZV00_11165 [Pseudomonas kielensis]|uniref:phage tail sheath family protein n=1 Tax=Pseudomonas kielensis TaxID=2762577 RepID=UPI002240AB7D|nr:phage tail sheath C-terminal domain-containing protein [Pseudomonas kielensis]UZM16225.1 hypothetical protein LZV00_11165 [Pseudomonas kielensis]
MWKAPANMALRGVSGLTDIVSDAEQGPMNDSGINVIRAFSDRGMMVWGARTQDMTLVWRYIPVRRLFNSVERDIQQMLRAVVFEPNNEATWERVRGAIDNHLRQLWRQGALLGNSEQEAYFVQVGKNRTMTPNDIDEGKLIVKVGMAAVKPAEFIVLQFSQNVK